MFIRTTIGIFNADLCPFIGVQDEELMAACINNPTLTIARYKNADAAQLAYERIIEGITLDARIVDVRE